MEECLFWKTVKVGEVHHWIAILIYVDDLWVIGSLTSLVEQTTEIITRTFTSTDVSWLFAFNDTELIRSEKCVFITNELSVERCDYIYHFCWYI